MTPKLARQIAGVVAAILVLAASLLLISYARWLREISDGNRALAAGDYELARKQYEIAAQRLESFSFARRMETPGYRQLVFNRARALYAANKDDDLQRMLESESRVAPFLTDSSEYHFWSGNLQFRRAIVLKDKQALQAGLQQAAESYRRALVAAPDDWDAKYNYELTAKLLESMRKGKDDTLERVKKGQMKVLREESDKDREQQNKIVPEKKS